MSLILEALKKSEAQRRLGQAPGLLSPALPLAAPRSSRLPWAITSVLALLLAVAGGWWWFAPWQATEPAPTAATPAAGSGAEAGSPAATGAEPATAAADERTAVSTPAAATAAPHRVDAAEASTRRAITPQDPAFRSIERESGAMPAGAALPTNAGPAASPREPAAAPAAAPPDPLEHAPPAQVPPAAPTQARPAPAPAAAMPPAAEHPAPVEAEPAMPGLRDLPATDRAALPPLKLSMHVYADVPAERFVLIDGRRYGEGMAIAPELLLHEIRRDGIVLEFRGRRFLLPRPG